MSSDSTRTALARQYARVPRTTLRWLPEMWKLERAASLAIYFVLLLRGRGYIGRTAFVRWSELAAEAGVGPAPARRAARALARSGIANFVADRAGVLEFSLPADAIAREGVPYFVGPGALIASGMWGALAPADRVVLWALACVAKPEVHSYLTTLELRDDLGGANWWAALNVDTDAASRGYGPDIARRVGETSLRELALATGLDRTSVWRAIGRMSQRSDGDLLRSAFIGGRVLFQLPAPLWEPSAQSGGGASN